MSTSNTIKIQMLDEDWKDTNLAVDLWTKTHGVASTLGVSKEIHGAKKFDDYTREISFTPEGFHKFQRIMKKSEMPEVWFDENLDSYAKSQGLNIHSSSGQSVSEPASPDVPLRILNFGYPMPRD